MRNSKIKKYLITALFILPMIVAISFVQIRINEIKSRDKLVNTEIVKNAPPVVAFVTVVLGSFRGLLADLLWLRTTALQEEGQYFEMVQLASWITKLQPKFTGGTAFLAWNMAYNISVTCSSFEDRWRWVQRGIELIRDEALIYNPADPILYKELGWIYQHKIGNMMDDAHQYYKNRMAVGLMEVLGKEEVDWEALAAAPKNDTELKAMLNLDDSIWSTLLSSRREKGGAYRNMAELERDFRLFGELPESIKKRLNNDEKRIKLLDDYLRAKWLRDKFKLDPAVICELNNKYGKLDWRLPEAHAIYWATQGIKHDLHDEVNQVCERMITQSLKDAFMGGRLIMADPDNPETFLCIPNLELADRAYHAYLEAYKRQNSSSFKDGMKNFLRDIVVMMYTFGKYDKAEKYFKILKKEDPRNPSLRLGLDQFVLKEWKEDARDATVKQAKAIVSSRLYTAYYLSACGEDDAADANMKLAEGVYNVYKQEHLSSWRRVGFSFDDMKDKMKGVVVQTLQKMQTLEERRRMLEESPNPEKIK